jgi:hypothetical protein
VRRLVTVLWALTTALAVGFELSIPSKLTVSPASMRKPGWFGAMLGLRETLRVEEASSVAAKPAELKQFELRCGAGAQDYRGDLRVILSSCCCRKEACIEVKNIGLRKRF